MTLITIGYCEDLTDPRSQSNPIGILYVERDSFVSFQWVDPLPKLDPTHMELIPLWEDFIKQLILIEWPKFKARAVPSWIKTQDPTNVEDFLTQTLRHNSFHVLSIEHTKKIPDQRVPGLPDIILTSQECASKILTTPEQANWLSYIISIGSVTSEAPSGFYEAPGAKLRLKFDDIEKASNLAGYEGCTEKDIYRLVGFCQRIAYRPGPVLLHCAAGISRSSAATLVLLTCLLGPGKENDAILHLLSVRKWSLENKFRNTYADICPNRRVIHMADRILGRDGFLLKACQNHFVYYNSWDPDA